MMTFFQLRRNSLHVFFVIFLMTTAWQMFSIAPGLCPNCFPSKKNSEVRGPLTTLNPGFSRPQVKPDCQPITTEQCGDLWQRTYCDFHYRSLQSPNTAKVLSYHCKEPSCGGVGIQIQGMVSLFYLALLTNSTFIMSWVGSKENYLEPNRINWSLPLEMFGNFHKSFWGCCTRPEGYDSIILEPKESFHDWITTKDIKMSLSQLEAIGTNWSFYEDLWLNPFVKHRAKELEIPTSPPLMMQCAIHFLFKKSDAMTKPLDEAGLSLPSLGTQGSSICQPIMTQECGHFWQTAYCSFHRISLQSPKIAKVLSYDCTGGNCGGLGNQFRGLISVFWLALLTKRTFVINWRRPGVLKEYLEPNRIHWNVPLSRFGKFHNIYWGCHSCRGSSVYDSSRREPKDKFENWISRADVESLLHPLQSIASIWSFPQHLRSNPFLKERAEKLDIPTTTRGMLGCAFHFLFKKTNAMETALDEARRSIFRKPPLLGIHVRTSDHHFGVNDPTSYSSRNASKFFICARRLNNLIRKINDTTRNLTWFVATDDKAVKQMAEISSPVQTITLNLEPKHSANARSSGAIIKDVFLDIFLLSESHYLLLSNRSSFGELAVAIGLFNDDKFGYGEQCLVNETTFLKTMSRVLG